MSIALAAKHLAVLSHRTSYNRFVELMEKEALSMAVMLKMFCLGECTGISYVDSTPLRVCKNKRIHNHKVFKGLTQVGKSTMGWFYGFKLHLLLNEKGEILNFVITPGNSDDRDPLKDEAFLKKIKGKLYADKGYISKQLTEILFVDGIHLVTGIKHPGRAERQDTAAQALRNRDRQRRAEDHVPDRALAAPQPPAARVNK